MLAKGLKKGHLFYIVTNKNTLPIIFFHFCIKNTFMKFFFIKFRLIKINLLANSTIEDIEEIITRKV